MAMQTETFGDPDDPPFSAADCHDLNLSAARMRSMRAERRITNFISRNEIEGRQDWAASWICFKAVAEFCAALRTPRKSDGGERGKKFAYDELIQAMACGAFDVSGRSRVLLLVSRGGKVLSITSNEMFEAREAFDPKTFQAAYLDNCWTRAGLIAAWFRQTGIPTPWGLDPRPTLSITRKRPLGAIDHEADVAIIDRAIENLAIEKKAGKPLSRRAAVKKAVSEFRREEFARKLGKFIGYRETDPAESEIDRLRAKMRRRKKLGEINRVAQQQYKIP
jgi:hypothetical protein